MLRTTWVLGVAGAVAAAGIMTAIPASGRDAPTSRQLASWGFTRTPNVAAWGPGGTMRTNASSLPAWKDLYITGRAPRGTARGQVLGLARYVPASSSDGYLTELGITTRVGARRSYVLHAQLGRVGLFGYSLGYLTGGRAPEAVVGEFQLRTTRGLAPAALRGGAATGEQLASWGFTRRPNVVDWPGGTAVLSPTGRAPAGTTIVLRGRAPRGADPGRVLTLKRFHPTDTQGSGSFTALTATTRVTARGTFRLAFRLGARGLSGYTVGFPTGGEWRGVEFQLRTT